MKEPLRGAPRVVSARLEGERLDLTLDTAPTEPVPVWVRQGYFPTWRNPEGEPVYLAAPTFQLTFVRQREAAVRIQRGRLEWGAALLSLMGVALLVWAVLSARQARTQPRPG